MKPITCNQEMGDPERLLCPAAPQGPAGDLEAAVEVMGRRQIQNKVYLWSQQDLLLCCTWGVEGS